MSLYKDCVIAGLNIDHHESDLYIMDCDEARKILRNYKIDNFSTFFKASDGKTWIDVPFAYNPFWERKK